VRLLSLSTSPIEGGAERYTAAIVASAVERGWETSVAIPVSPGTERLRAEYRSRGVSIYPLPCVDPFFNGRPASAGAITRATAGVARLILRLRPSVVHTTLPWPVFGMANVLGPALCRVPALVTFQLVTGDFHVGRSSRLYALARRSQTWATVSDFNRQELAYGFGMPPERIAVIPNGAKVPAAAPTAIQRGEARGEVLSELSLPPDSKLVLSVGRLHEQKGHHDLIAAVSGLRTRQPEVRLLIAGEGPGRRDLESRALEAGVADRVHLLGQRADVPRLLCAADVFAFPSLFEGLPFAMLEAMGYALPVVAARFEGVDEIVEDGKDALLVPVEDPDALGTALAQLLEDTARAGRLAASARARALELSEEVMAERTLGLLGALARRQE
jgi:glycosyltransferase involved in cell wall biosynthesis